jgi:hypothetical protein
MKSRIKLLSRKLENRRRCKLTVGSNPTLSAILRFFAVSFRSKIDYDFPDFSHLLFHRVQSRFMVTRDQCGNKCWN